MAAGIKPMMSKSRVREGGPDGRAQLLTRSNPRCNEVGIEDKTFLLADLGTVLASAPGGLPPLPVAPCVSITGFALRGKTASTASFKDNGSVDANAPDKN